MNNPFVVLDKDGKPVFIGHDDLNNPPNPPDHGPALTEECPVCHNKVPYLVGENTSDGGVMGCESCWKPSQHPLRNEVDVNEPKEIIY
jgi:hypothetical protein